jgi:hypothetical protein
VGPGPGRRAARGGPGLAGAWVLAECSQYREPARTPAATRRPFAIGHWKPGHAASGDCKVARSQLELYFLAGKQLT